MDVSVYGTFIAWYRWLRMQEYYLMPEKQHRLMENAIAGFQKTDIRLFARI